MLAVLFKESEIKIISQKVQNNADFDDNRYVTAEDEMSDIFYDVDEDISSDSDSNSSRYESAEEEFLSNFHDSH